MKGRSLLGAGVRRRAARLTTALLAVACGGAMGGCLSRPLEPVAPDTTSTVFLPLKQSSVDKIDLLLMVDNSSSMGDKQDILSVAIPDLLGELLNPYCVDAVGTKATMQPAGPLDACPDPTSEREFTPVLDIHIGLISSSLGTFGATGCGATPSPNLDDQGHLLNRAPAGSASSTVSTYQNEGFLAWDPSQKLIPPGEASLTNIETSLGNLVTGDNEVGCGFESQNESWYRLLVDPAPYANYTFDSNSGAETKSGLDQAILTDRKDFLRPDSLLAILVVTDETDTSIKQQSITPIIAQESYTMPHARSECTAPGKGPLDPCCSSCGLPAPAGCPANETEEVCATAYVPCDGDDDTTCTDNFDIHAFGLGTHKARYGIEFFYPPSRYVAALTSTTVVDESGATVPNPLFTPATPGGAARDPGLVFYAAITGVPWQLIARPDADGTPDLGNGFKSPSELAMQDGKGHTFWQDIVGDPEHYVPPISPFMQESSTPRTGTDPITGLTTVSGNALNGGDRTILPLNAPGNIEYACTFTLATPRDCTVAANQQSCDCCPPNSPTCTNTPSPNNPLCAPNPNDSGNPTLQVAAKAYPGIKNLAVVEGVGGQGIAASICPAQVNDNTLPTYGYRPAMQAILARLKTAIGGECLPQPLTPNAEGQVSCVVLEARNTDGAACNCDTTARQAVPSTQQAAITAAQSTTLGMASNWNCFCEITQTTGAELTSCENDVNSTADGWCYVSSTVGNAKLVSTCSSNEQQKVRFVGKGEAAPGATTFITCTGD